MKPLYCLFILTCTALLTGCATSLQQPQRTDMLQIKSLSTLNGVYQNTGITKSHGTYNTLWYHLNSIGQIDTITSPSATITLLALDNGKIRATLETEGSTSKSIEIKGKFKDGYFVAKPKRSAVPIPLLYGKFKNKQVQLSLNQDNSLHLDQLHNEWGWVFLFLANNNTSTSNDYKKVGE
ncbi:hypothetical protein [Pedobacter nanyangensis]|uniref:hypothetical protein n=1 Tax=Pedobacter nanyangensis TaxID=1562389 RepID=UPI000DE34B7C|nr:hypothetical protein [Pedobacter nanyangensis]